MKHKKEKMETLKFVATMLAVFLIAATTFEVVMQGSGWR